jgi:3-oxoacid CoA-transferase subunit B
MSDTHDDLANWITAGKTVKSMGGAIDRGRCAPGCRADAARGRPKERRMGMQKFCASAPSRSRACALFDRIITGLGVIDVSAHGLRMIELAHGVMHQEISGKDRR